MGYSKGQLQFHKLLIAELETRRLANPSFSLRAFARFLQIPITTLKFLIDGKRKPNVTTLQQIARRCEWSDQVLDSIRVELAGSRRAARKSMAKTSESTEDPEVLGDIIYFALSKLAQLPNQSAALNSLSKSLGVTEIKAKAVLTKLQSSAYVRSEGGKLRRGDKELILTDNPPGDRSRRLQTQMLHRMQKVVDQEEFKKGRSAMGFIGVSETDLPRLSKNVFRYFRALQKDFPGDESSQIYAVMFSVLPFATTK